MDENLLGDETRPIQYHRVLVFLVTPGALQNQGFISCSGNF